MSTTTETDDSNSDVNISRLREVALRGKEYREELEFTYLGEDMILYIRPLTGKEFLPIAAFLEDRLDMDAEEAKERIEEGKDEDGGIDPSNFDTEFVGIMQQAAAMGIDTEKGDAEGLADEDEVLETIEMLIGGKSLEIAERVMDLSSDAESAEKFRRDGGGE